MAKHIEACSLEEWTENAVKISGFSGSTESFQRANTFSIMQFIGKDAKDKKNHIAYRLVLDGKPVAWISVHAISSTVSRFRGLYVKPEFRGQGFMKDLVQHALKHLDPSTEKVLSLSVPESIAFYKKNNFQVEERFIPRPTDDDLNGEPLTLVVYRLTAKSFNN